RSPAAGQARVRKLYRAFAPARAFVPPRRHAFALRRGGGPWEHGEGPVAAAPANRPLQVSIAAQRSGQGARSPGREEEVTRRWGCGPGTGRRTPAGAGAVASAGAAEVLRGDRVQELPELLDLVLLLVRYRDAGLLQDVLAGEDRRAGAQGEGDGVGGAGAHLHPVGEDEVGEEDALAEIGDVDGAQLDAEGVQDVPEQVVREGARGQHPLLGEGDRGRFDRP